MIPNLTDEEHAALVGANSKQAWHAAVDAVKKARGGRDYPPDWYVRIIATGIAQSMASRFGS